MQGKSEKSVVLCQKSGVFGQETYARCTQEVYTQFECGIDSRSQQYPISSLLSTYQLPIGVAGKIRDSFTNEDETILHTSWDSLLSKIPLPRNENSVFFTPLPDYNTITLVCPSIKRVARGMQGGLINIWRFSRVCNVFQQLTCARQGG